MATSPMNMVIQQLRTAFGLDGAELTDGELLTLFLSSRDDGALAALIRRHAHDADYITGSALLVDGGIRFRGASE